MKVQSIHSNRREFLATGIAASAAVILAFAKALRSRAKSQRFWSIMLILLMCSNKNVRPCFAI